MDYVKAHQPDMMLFVCGMCGILAVMTLITRSLPRKTRAILACMEISAMLLLFFDRFAYIYKGDASATGYYMVRISNGMVYFLSLLIPFFVTRFLSDVYKNEAKLPGPPIQLVIADSLFFGGAAMLIYALQSGLYYTFDETNNYHRAPWNAVCYVVPLLIVIFQEWSIFRYGKRINRRLARSMIVSIALPTIASIFQIFAYGLSLINMTTAMVVCVFYTYAL
ncbi:MAG: hypothetical protein J6125_01310, partial [Clostridia bacterium]|nr:hypothetical protein [Clostridia bacterium]